MQNHPNAIDPNEDYQILLRQLRTDDRITRELMIDTIRSNVMLTLLVGELVMGWQEPRYDPSVPTMSYGYTCYFTEAKARGAMQDFSTSTTAAIEQVVNWMRNGRGIKRFEISVDRTHLWLAQFSQDVSGTGIVVHFQGLDVSFPKAICRAALKAVLYLDRSETIERSQIPSSQFRTQEQEGHGY